MKEVFEYILSLLKSRIFPLIMVVIVMITVLVNRLFNLQIINGQSYVKDLTNSIQKDMSVPATRGRIYDKNGILLAYNDLAFAVKISDSGKYNNNATKNKTINNSIDKTLSIIESNGDTYSNDFPIIYENEIFSYNIEGTSLLRFLRDSYGRESINALTEEDRATSAESMFKYLCGIYQVNIDEFGIEHSLMIVNLRRYMAANSYNRFMSFTIANEVSDKTVASILENSDELIGVTVEEQYIRRYVDSIYCSHILGYTGTISTAELEEMGSGYENNDIIGKAGIEKSMESVLSGTKGERSVYVDTVGRITEILEETEPVAGNDVYLTIDINLQKAVYNAIENQLVDILLTYLTSGNDKITYKSNGDIEKINILAREVYFALIDNNIVSLKEIEAGKTDNQAEIYDDFLDKKEDTLEWLKDELMSYDTDYGELSEEHQLYIWYVYDLLKKENVFSLANVDYTDSVYYDWIYGDSTSMQELLTYGISKNWIDLSTLSSQQYTSLQESYDALVDYILAELNTDTAFFKKMYKYMINSGQISGRQVCMLLYEQGILDMDSSSSRYDELSSGTMTAYDFITVMISEKLITPGQLALQPCSASAVITNPNNGDILALVSYPSYDNNKLSGTVDSKYYNLLIKDNASPMLNRATQSATAPGSTYKICSTIAGMDTGIINSSTTFFCNGKFDTVTPPPKCWQAWGHGDEYPATAIRDSCNVFFYNVGYNLACSKNGNYNSTYGTNILQKYSDMLGLSTMCNIELEESAARPSNQNVIASAIGQGNHNYSTLNLARYVTTIANSGTVYDLTIVDKITDSEGNVIKDNSANVSNSVDLNQSIWDTAHSGMIMAGQSYYTLNNLDLKIAGKSGTAQEKTSDPDHSLLITYAPYDEPEICTSVCIQNGYSSSTSIDLTVDIYKLYYDLD